MKYLAAYCLAALGGAQNPGSQVKAILESVGVAVDDAQLEAVVKALDGQNLQEVHFPMINLICPGHCQRYAQCCCRFLRRIRWW